MATHSNNWSLGADLLFLLGCPKPTAYPEYPRWLLKIDPEAQSRGLAYLDVTALRSVAGVAAPDPAEVRAELEEALGQAICLVDCSAYPLRPLPYGCPTEGCFF